MPDTTILTIIDKHLQQWIDKGLNSLPATIAPEMTKPGEHPDQNGWQQWYPVVSTVTDNDIAAIENKLAHKLPDSYKLFLQHRHFYELYIAEARFSGHEINNWKNHLPRMAFEGYPAEWLIDKGYIPFADWSDWGVLCFDTHQQEPGNEYPVILWDHERWDEYQPVAAGFYELLISLDKQAEVDAG